MNPRSLELERETRRRRALLDRMKARPGPPLKVDAHAMEDLADLLDDPMFAPVTPRDWTRLIAPLIVNALLGAACTLVWMGGNPGGAIVIAVTGIALQLML